MRNKMIIKKFVSVAAVSAMVFVSDAGTTYYVNGASGSDTNEGSSVAPFRTIHRGLAVASDGDRVEVAPATYTLDADHQALVVTNAVELIGKGSDRTDVTVYFANSTETWTGFGGRRLICVSNALAKVSHIRFQGPKNRYNRVGSGIDARGSVAYVYAGTMSDCVFCDSCIDSGFGAGVYLDSADAVLEDSLLTNLYAHNGSDNGSALTIVNGIARRCDISGNIARQVGPVAMNGATARLVDSVVTNNASAGVNPMWNNGTWGSKQCGGGVWIRNAGAVVSNCVIAANRANLPGGGSLTLCTGGGLVFAAPGKVYNTVIRDNYAYLAGGGVYGEGYLYNCLIANNVSENGQGGGVYGGAHLYNCTVVGNESQLENGVDGIGGSSTIVNGIVWGNGERNYDSASMTFSCSYPLPVGQGNIANNPKLRNSHTRGMASLPNDSPCANAGTWQDWMPGFSYLNEVPMPNEEGAVTMGCNAPYQTDGLLVIFK